MSLHPSSSYHWRKSFWLEIAGFWLNHPSHAMAQNHYSLPPLPSGISKLSTRQKVQQRAQRAILQNNAASLRYRRSQTLKREQQQLQITEIFQNNARLHLRQARIKAVVDAINKKVSQLAAQGCDHCLQTSLLLQQSPSPQPPMVKIEPATIVDLKDVPWIDRCAWHNVLRSLPHLINLVLANKRCIFYTRTHTHTWPT